MLRCIFLQTEMQSAECCYSCQVASSLHFIVCLSKVNSWAKPKANYIDGPCVLMSFWYALSINWLSRIPVLFAMDKKILHYSKKNTLALFRHYECLCMFVSPLLTFTLSHYTKQIFIAATCACVQK